jgi:hypothetical protein
MPKTATTTDGTLQIFAACDLDSSALARIPNGVEVELGDTITVEGREWIQARLKDGTAGFVLAPSARGHTSLASERSVLAGIALTDNERQQKPAGPSGVGGWLILPIFGLLVQPLLITYGVALHGEIWANTWFLTFAAAAGMVSGWSVFVAIALLNRWPNAPRLAQAYLIISCVLSIGYVALMAIAAGVSSLSWLGAIPSTVLWVRYFEVSDRVYATYGPLSPGPFRLKQAWIMGFTAALLVCFSAIGIAEHRRQVWTGFQSDEGIYGVEAPGSARKSTLPDGTTQVAFGNDTRGFVVLNSAIVQQDVKPQAYFESVRDKTIAGMKGSIISSSPFTVDGHSGIEFSATFPGPGATGEVWGRVYMAGSKGFLLLVSGPQGGRTASEAERFFQSFQIKTSH